MAVTQEQVDAAYNRRQAAEQALLQAQAELQALGNDPQGFPGSPKHEAAKNRVSAAQSEYTRADGELRRVSAAYNKENPPPKQTDKGQAEKDRIEEARQREKNRADPSFGLSVTDKERADIESQGKPRQDSPAQVQNANTSAQSAAERGRHNQVTEAQNAVKEQREALVQAGTLFNTTRGQVSREAEARVDAGIKGISEVRGAATTLVNTAVQVRDQNVALQRARTAFVQDVLTTAMPQVLQLMLKTPKGSKVAANFLKAFLVMANEAAKNAGLMNEPPPIDPKTPGFQTLMNIQGYQLPEQLPTMPTSNQISMQAAQAAAAGGFPIPGWQGGIGTGALATPEPPGASGSSRRQNGAGVDPIAAAAQSSEGQALLQGLKAQVAGIEAKPEAERTPQEQQMLASAKQAYQDKLKEIAAKQQAQAGANQQAQTPASTEQGNLRNEIRTALISGDPNQRVRIMSLAVTAKANRDAGKPLSPAETAILANLDPGDLEVISQNMNPQVMDILTRHGQGQKVTPQEIATVQTAVLGTSTGIKTRPTQPPPKVDVPQLQGPAESQPTPPGVPADAPPLMDRANMPDPVLMQDAEGRKFWTNRPYVEDAKSVGAKEIYDPAKAATPSTMPQPFESRSPRTVYSDPEIDPNSIKPSPPKWTGNDDLDALTWEIEQQQRQAARDNPDTLIHFENPRMAAQARFARGERARPESYQGLKQSQQSQSSPVKDLPKLFGVPESIDTDRHTMEFRNDRDTQDFPIQLMPESISPQAEVSRQNFEFQNEPDYVMPRLIDPYSFDSRDNNEEEDNRYAGLFSTSFGYDW